MKRKYEYSVWQGPTYDGVTQSLLSNWMNCRERFRLEYVQGLVMKDDSFSRAIVFGEMFHVCSEAYYSGQDWKSSLKTYTKQLTSDWPYEASQIVHWYKVCEVLFPLYLNHYAKHKLEKMLTPLYSEKTFDEVMKLPSGRIVRLRGKWDQVFTKTVKGKQYLVLQDDKTKGEFEVEQVLNDLPLDNQMNFYCVALDLHSKSLKNSPALDGFRYNLVRRPLSGGKYSISQKKGRQTKKGIVGAETEAEFYARLGSIIKEDPDWFFQRVEVTITHADVEAYKNRTLVPLLENLCDWWEEVCRHEGSPPYSARHFLTPFGVYNSLRDGVFDPYAEYLISGNDENLIVGKTLFTELQ